MGKRKGGRRGRASHGTCLQRTRDKLKEERQRDSTEEGTVAGSVVARTFD